MNFQLYPSSRLELNLNNSQLISSGYLQSLKILTLCYLHQWGQKMEAFEVILSPWDPPRLCQRIKSQYFDRCGASMASVDLRKIYSQHRLGLRVRYPNATDQPTKPRSISLACHYSMSLKEKRPSKILEFITKSMHLTQLIF